MRRRIQLKLVLHLALIYPKPRDKNDQIDMKFSLRNCRVTYSNDNNRLYQVGNMQYQVN